MINVVAVSARRRHGARRALGRLRLRPGNAAARRRGSDRRRQRPRQLRLSDVEQLQAGCLRPPGASRSSTTARTSSSASRSATSRRPSAARSARSSSTSTSTTRRAVARRSTERRERLAQLPDRAGLRVEPADPGAGLRPALRERERARRSARSRSAPTRSRTTSPSRCRRRASAHPGPAGAFTVVLTGQDGFSGDQARGFQSTPQDFQFGVCAAASVDPHCTVDPSTVPKAIDVITPGRRAPVRRARLHPAPAGRPAGRHDPVEQAVERSRRFDDRRLATSNSRRAWLQAKAAPRPVGSCGRLVALRSRRLATRRGSVRLVRRGRDRIRAGRLGRGRRRGRGAGRPLRAPGSS